MAGQQTVPEKVLAAARMVAKEGLGEGRPAHGFMIIVGDSSKILADACPDGPDSILCTHGDFRTYADRRLQDLYIGDCLGARKRNFQNLFHEDGAIVVDRESGQVCCGGFYVHDTSLGIRTGGTRRKAAAAMATKAGGCYIVLASDEHCGSIKTAPLTSAKLKVFDGKREPKDVDVHVPEAVRKKSLKEWLRPLTFSADLYRYNQRFIEGTRKWILDDLEKWRRKGPRCKVLLACPGFGKTTIAARLYKERKKHVLAIHFFRQNDSYKRDPRRMIVSIASQIAEAHSDFKKALGKVRKNEGDATDAHCLRPTARALADCLLFNPLTDLGPPQGFNIETGRYMIIIDALDEADHDAKNELLNLVALDFPYKLPPWVAVLVTASPEVGINRRVAQLDPTVLDHDSYRGSCDRDVEVFLRKILARKLSNAGRLSSAIEAIATRSERLFQYLHYIRDKLEFSDDIDASINALPAGLSGVYQEQLEQVLGPAGLGNEHSHTRWIFEAIVAAQGPIHVTNELPRLSGVPKHKVIDCVPMLSQLQPIRCDDRVYFQKPFVEWLTREKRALDPSEFIVNSRAAHGRVALACAFPLIRLLKENSSRFQSDRHAVAALEKLIDAHFVDTLRFGGDESRQSKDFHNYVLRWSVTHFVEAGGKFRDVSLSLLHSLRFLMKRAPQIDSLISDALLLPEAALLHRALLLARNHLRKDCKNWLAEELWQRLLPSASMPEFVDLKRLADDARKMARAELRFSARHANLIPADSYLHCVLEGHQSSVKAVTTFDAIGYTWVASCSEDKTVRIWNPMQGGREHCLLKGHSHPVNGVTAFAANGRVWVASLSFKKIHIWDPVKGGEAIQVLEGHSKIVNGMACIDTNEATLLASCSKDKSVCIWECNCDNDGDHKFIRLKKLERHTGVVLGVTFVRAEGRTSVVSCSFDKTIRVLDLLDNDEATGPERVLQGHSACVNGVTAIEGLNNSALVASCSDDRTVRIWDPINGGNALRVLEDHSEIVQGVTAFVDPGDKWVVASFSEDKTVCVWRETNNGMVTKVLEGHTQSVTDVTTFVADNGKWVASCSKDNTVRIWNAIDRRSEAVHVLKGHLEEVNGLTAFNDTKDHVWVASCSTDTTVRIWDSMKASQKIRALEGHSSKLSVPSKVSAVTAFVDAQGNTYVASCSDDKTVRLWDPIQGDIATSKGTEHSYCGKGVTAFYADGRNWLVTCSDKEIRKWDTNDPGQAHSTYVHGVYVIGVTAVVETNGEAWLASCSYDMKVHIWDATKLDKPVRELQGHEAEVTGVTAFADDQGTWVASCSKDKTVRIWNAKRDGDFVYVLDGHSDEVNGVTAFVNANGTWVASCSKDKTVRIWNAHTGVQELLLKGHSGEVNGVTAFVDANDTLRASGSEDTTVRIWDAIYRNSDDGVLNGQLTPVNDATCVHAHSSNTWVASCSNDGTARIWDAISGGPALFVILLDSPPTAISTTQPALAHARDACAGTPLLVIGHKDGQVTFWECMQVEDTQDSCGCVALLESCACVAL